MSERQRWPIVVASMPLWPIVWLLGLASVARMKLGFWPRYSHPDPTDLHWPILDNTLLPLFLLAPVVLLVSLILAFRRRFAGRQDWRIFLLTFVSFVILISWLKFDPGGFVEWWLD